MDVIYSNWLIICSVSIFVIATILTIRLKKAEKNTTASVSLWISIVSLCITIVSFFVQNIPAITESPKTTTYILTFHPNWGIGGNATQTFTGVPDNGGSLSGMLNGGTPIRAGYRFLGWSFEQNSIIPTHENNKVTAVYGNRTLYAVWKQDILSNGEAGRNSIPEQVDTPIQENRSVNINGSTLQNVSITTGDTHKSDTTKTKTK